MARSNQNRYSGLKTSERVGYAMAVLNRIGENRERILSLAIAVQNQLRPLDGSEPVDHTALKLAEILIDEAGNCAHDNDLKECLQAMETAA